MGVDKPWLSIVSIFGLAVALLAATLPAGTEIQLRLTSEVSSDKPSGQPVTAVVIAPVPLNGTGVIGFGTQLTGVTADAHANQPAANGSNEVPATLRLQITTIRDDHGQSKPIACVLEGVDNARESVDQAGLITGITASHTFTSLADVGVNKVESKSESLGQLLSSIKSATVKPADPAIDYKPGVEFTVKLTKPLDWTPSGDMGIVPSITPADTLAGIVAQVPFRTEALELHNPSDLTNLMFIGTKEQIEAALKGAGWFAADPLGRASKMRTAQAIIEDRGYDEAPMSVLTLDGQPPVMAFEKQNNTFASRHHIRIWQVQQTFQGQSVFVAAATHDIKIYYSKTSRSITHGIDPNIDKERAKVVNDLLFTGQIEALSIVDRPNIPKDISNATGDHLQTDDKIAALEFKKN
ncbi:MAG: LssY C-terminal domain-containing protein [Acidobacteriaceae bacterium]|nr:LssY C-terminal domain-containing protein [Acidobacteriaceae bacterium]